MDRNHRRTASENPDPIEQRLLDDQQEGRQNIIDAAADASAADQESPDHPSRIERSHGVEDPSHSRGSGRRGPGERDFNQQK